MATGVSLWRQAHPHGERPSPLRLGYVALNSALEHAGFRIEPCRGRYWDRRFRAWIRAGANPNDLGDDEWRSDLLELGLAEHYLPHVRPDSVVCELGPGTGRLTRHLVHRCAELHVADISPFVCKWMRRFLADVPNAHVHRVVHSQVPTIADASCDCVLAHGVFQHTDFDTTFWLLREAARLLVPGGAVAFNYDSLLAEESLDLLEQEPSYARHHGYRLHHPDGLAALARRAGFSHAETFETGTRVEFAELRR